jgi:hypothetical protein
VAPPGTPDRRPKAVNSGGSGLAGDAHILD